jgi:hypothetical protein
MNENQIADIWVFFKEYLDRKVLDTVAERYIELLVDHGVSDKQLDASVGYDDSLDDAINYYLNGDSEEDEEDEWDDD